MPIAPARPYPAIASVSVRLTREQYDDLTGRLFGLLVSLDDRLVARDARLIHEFIEAGEFGLALEQVADVLAEEGTPVSEGERSSMLALNVDMDMGERVPKALMFCPPSG